MILLPERNAVKLSMYLSASHKSRPDIGIIAQEFRKTAFLAVGAILAERKMQKLQICNYSD